jgi:hypothetical protein
LEKSCFVLIPFIDTSPSELMRSSILISLVRVISCAGALSCGCSLVRVISRAGDLSCG